MGLPKASGLVLMRSLLLSSHKWHELVSSVMRCDSITVSSTWELTSVSMRYSQGDGVNTSLSRLMYCTHV